MQWQGAEGREQGAGSREQGAESWGRSVTVFSKFYELIPPGPPSLKSKRRGRKTLYINGFLPFPYFLRERGRGMGLKEHVKGQGE